MDIKISNKVELPEAGDFLLGTEQHRASLYLKVTCLRQTRNGMPRQMSIAVQPRTSLTTEKHEWLCLKLAQQKLCVINWESLWLTNSFSPTWLSLVALCRGTGLSGHCCTRKWLKLHKLTLFTCVAEREQLQNPCLVTNSHLSIHVIPICFKLFTTELEACYSCRLEYQTKVFYISINISFLMKKKGKQKYFRIMPYTFLARITPDILFFYSKKANYF